MSSFGKNNNSFDNNQSLLLQSLMGRLQLRPPYLHTNSFLSHSLEDLLSLDPNLCSSESDIDDNDDDENVDATNNNNRTHLSKEESKLEKAIIRTILSGDTDSLKANSGQAVSIGDHHVCVGFHEEPDSDYRVWEWHGHIMLFDDENGYSPEYIYGNYFERLNSKAPNVRRGNAANGGEEEEEEEEESGGGDVGLRGLIGEDDLGNGRILRRNLNVGSAK